MDKSNDSVNKKQNCCELLFTTCFISELIYRAFPMQNGKKKDTIQKNHKTHFQTSLNQRMTSFNMLSSLLSQNKILDQNIFIKTMHLMLDHFEKSMSNPGQRKELQQFYKEIEMKLSQEDGSTNDFAVQHYYSKLFHHCMV